jgi:hypothetical protein
VASRDKKLVAFNQDLNAAARALISGRTDQLDQCSASLESAALLVKTAGISTGELPLEVVRVRALLQNAREYYAGLAGALNVHCFGYDAGGNARSVPALTGTHVEFSG